MITIIKFTFKTIPTHGKPRNRTPGKYFGIIKVLINTVTKFRVDRVVHVLLSFERFSV